MEDQKLENLLNLALSSSEEEREKSGELNVGYDAQERTWELIVKHSGSLERLRDRGIRVDELMSGYAILVVPESLVGMVAGLPEIEYVEKPKRLFFAVNQAKAASCITPLQVGEGRLAGAGVLVAVIDSGIDYFHEDFRREDGTTRILKLWDQSLDQVFTAQEINQALETGSRAQARQLVPSVDLSGHGTAVAGIAAGNGRGSGGQYRGVAFESDLLVVKLGVPRTLGIAREGGFPRTTELMRAMDFVVRQAGEYRRPVAINLSFGNTYGSHDGTSLLETFIDEVSDYGRLVIVVGTGNEGEGSGHGSGILSQGTPVDVELSIAPYETGFGVQLWKSYVDIFTIQLVSPSGEVAGRVDERLGPQSFAYGGTKILLYYGEPSPYSRAQEIYFDFIPVNQYLDSGIWKIRLEPAYVVDGRYDLWLPSRSVLNPATRFLQETPYTTLTIPSTAAKVVSVGAYDDSMRTYADFSGRGYTRATNQVKPDLAAPGVNIITARSGGGAEGVTGTSFAAPMVTGSAALMMEWGMVQGNDPYLYGEKVKAYLIRGAKQLPGFLEWPNPLLGYGVLCLRDSLPL